MCKCIETEPCCRRSLLNKSFCHIYSLEIHIILIASFTLLLRIHWAWIIYNKCNIKAWLVITLIYNYLSQKVSWKMLEFCLRSFRNKCVASIIKILKYSNLFIVLRCVVKSYDCRIKFLVLHVYFIYRRNCIWNIKYSVALLKSNICNPVITTYSKFGIITCIVLVKLTLIILCFSVAFWFQRFKSQLYL